MNNYLIAIDPSLRSTGVALFYDKQIIATKCLKTPSSLKGFDDTEWLSAIEIIKNLKEK